MKFILALTLLPILAAASDTSGLSWKKAKPGWTYEFPRDEFSHPNFKTEWWYFTGNLEAEGGRRFGYQLTFFRQGIRPPAERTPVKSEFVQDHIWFAHFAISDIDGGRFYHAEETSRGAFGQAGSGGEHIVWIKNWTLDQSAEDPGHYQFKAATDGFALDLKLEAAKPMVFHGKDGVSPKANDDSSASHYYSFMRLTSSGSLKIGNREFAVRGDSWYDREWSTSALSKDQIGWDWFAIQFDNGTELMLFQLRDPDGRANFKSGSFVNAAGEKSHLGADDFVLTPTQRWKAPDTGVDYPIEWKVELLARNEVFHIKAAQKNQQLRMAAMTYWEGATVIKGETANGRGYLEMTGYDGKMTPLNQ